MVARFENLIPMMHSIADESSLGANRISEEHYCAGDGESWHRMGYICWAMALAM